MRNLVMGLPLGVVAGDGLVGDGAARAWPAPAGHLGQKKLQLSHSCAIRFKQ